MAKRLTAGQAADKWANNLGAATDNIRRGVMALQTSPTEAAANRADAYVQGVQRAVSSGRWQARLRSVTLQSWQQSMINKGLPIIAERARLAKGKFAQFMQRWMNYLESIRSQLNQMPRGTLDQNIARAVFMIRAAKAFKERGLNNAGGEPLAVEA